MLAEEALKKLILEKFANTRNLNQKSNTERLTGWLKEKTNNCYGFFRPSTINSVAVNQPLLTTPNPDLEPIQLATTNQHSKPIPWCYAIALMACAGIGFYSGFIFLNTSEAVSQLLMTQINSLSELFGVATEYIAETITELIKYCGVETNSLVGAQIMIMLTQRLYFLGTRSAAEIELTGNLKFKSWAVGSIVAAGATLPLASLDISTAENKTETIMAYFAAAATWPACLFGGKIILQFFAPQYFSETHDDTAAQFTKPQQAVLKKFKNLMVGRLYNQLANALVGYQNKNATTVNEFKKLLLNLKETKTNEDLKKLFDYLLLSDESIEGIATVQTSRITLALQNISKGSLIGTIGLSSLALVISDILTAYFTGSDLVSNVVGKVMLGILAAGLTSLASGGIALYSLQDVAKKIWNGEMNIIKSTDPKKFYILAIVLIIGGVFSGGAGAYAGFIKMQRLLIDLGYAELAEWIPKILETLGYTGAVAVDTPYCLAFAMWLICLYSLNTSDCLTRELLTFANDCQALASSLFNLKMGYVRDFMQSEFFGNTKTLHKLGLQFEELVTIGFTESLEIQLTP